MLETVNDTTKKRSALEITSLALALLAGLYFVILLMLLYSAHGETFFYILLGGGLLSFFITSTGVITGSIALYRRGIQIGWVRLVGLVANIASLTFSIFLLLLVCVAFFVGYLLKDLHVFGHA